MNDRIRPVPGVALLLIAVTFGPMAAPIANAQSAETLHHVHGLAYTADGRKLMAPSHQGVAVYAEGRWSKAPGPQHDYMGYAATMTRIYSSGHPAPGSGLKNPFGLIRSKDGGATWNRLGLEGESDFHLLATGWNTNAVYVWTPERNSRMPKPGLYYTVNDGSTWQRAAAKELAGKLRALAVHPRNAQIVAGATSAGIHVSRNSGDDFEPLARGEAGLAVFFDLDEKHLWYSSFAGGPRLVRVQLQGGTKTTSALPPLENDAVAYVAQNPVNPKEYAIATFERSVFVSKDAGRTWTQIADRGRGK